MLAQIDPRTPDYYLARGDTTRALDVQLLDSGCEPVSLDVDAVVKVVVAIRPRNANSSTTEKHDCIITDAQNGSVRHVFPDGSTNIPGDYLFNFTVIWRGGTQDSYPKGRYPNMLLRITPSI